MKSPLLVILTIASASLFSGCGEKCGESAGKTPEDKLAQIDKVANQGPFEADWNSLAKYEIPEWYQDAKFGIFIHWGVYAVPGYGSEWYPRNMYVEGHDVYKHHRSTFGEQTEFGYKDLIPKFKAEKFDPAAWAKLFKGSGAKYVIPVAEHHDGFPMYASEYTKWDASEMGPKRDLIQELSETIRAEGLHFGVSSHRAENWWFFDGGRKTASDVQDDQYRDLYGPAMDRDDSENGVTPPNKAFLDDWLLRTVELVDRFEPEIIWFDWWIARPEFHQHLQTFSSYYYNEGAKWDDMVAINYKKFGGESFPDTAGVLDIERGGLAEIRELFWQTDTSVSKNSWGYIDSHDYKTVNSLIDDLIDIVSKNGCMLLNIGPRADGTIPEREQEMLLEMGEWLELNGEAIYETRPWVIYGEGATKVVDGTLLNDAEHHRKDFNSGDIRFTQNDGKLYAIVMDWPEAVNIRALGLDSDKGFGKVGSVELIGYDGELEWQQSSETLSVKFPSEQFGKHAFVLVVSK